MERPWTKQSGFSTLGILLIVLAIVITTAGVVIYQRQKSNGSVHTVHPNSQQTGNTNTTTTQTKPNPNEFAVTELGFKLILPDGIKDLKYAVTSSTAFFTTSTLEQMDGAGTQCTASNGAIGAITRTSQDPKATGGSYITSKAVGSFYLFYNSPQQGCSRNTATNQLQLSQSRLLQQALNTATPVN